MESLPQPGKLKKCCNLSRELIYVCKKIVLCSLCPFLLYKKKYTFFFILLFYIVFPRYQYIKCLCSLYTSRASPILTTTIYLISPLYRHFHCFQSFANIHNTSGTNFVHMLFPVGASKSL